MVQTRETAPVLTSDNESKNILVLSDSFVPPLRANLGRTEKLFLVELGEIC